MRSTELSQRHDLFIRGIQPFILLGYEARRFHVATGGAERGISTREMGFYRNVMLM